MKVCMKFRQLKLLLFSVLVLGFIAESDASNYRAPQNYVPDTDLFANYQEDSFFSDIWKNDHNGVLRNLKLRINSWEKQEKYNFNYGLSNYDESVRPSIDQKRRVIEKGLIKYLDKRLMYKVKNASKKSSLSKVRSARKALRPSSTTSISKNLKIKFRAKLLRGRANVLFINPWVNATAQFSLSGKMEFNLRKEFQAPQILTQVNINFHNEEWTALMQKSISKSLKAQILSIQPTKSFALDDADRRIQLIYQKNF